MVITVLPGFVRTKMTEDMDLPDALMGEPEEIAEDIFMALKRGRAVIYTRWYWRWIMLVIRFIPEKLFVRLSL